jgi:hypothetical protein
MTYLSLTPKIGDFRPVVAGSGQRTSHGVLLPPLLTLLKRVTGTSREATQSSPHLQWLEPCGELLSYKNSI